MHYHPKRLAKSIPNARLLSPTKTPESKYEGKCSALLHLKPLQRRENYRLESQLDLCPCRARVTSATVAILDLVRSRLSRDLEEYWTRDQIPAGCRSSNLEDWKDCRDRDRQRKET